MGSLAALFCREMRACSSFTSTIQARRAIRTSTILFWAASQYTSGRPTGSAKELEKIAERFNAADPASVELHGNPMVQGNKGWKQIAQADRITAIQDALYTLNRTHNSTRTFAVVVEKHAVSSENPMEFAFEQLLNRFDRYLGRLHLQGNTQRGLLVVDKSSFERRFQGLAHNFRSQGHRWGRVRNIAEVPLFADSRASRLIQLADLVSYGVFRYFEKSDDRFMKIMDSRFDREGAQVHGLVRWERRDPLASKVTELPTEQAETAFAARFTTIVDNRP